MPTLTPTKTRMVRVTALEAANRMNLDLPRTRAYLTILVDKKVAKVIGTVPANSLTGQGQPSKIYEFPKNWLLGR